MKRIGTVSLLAIAASLAFCQAFPYDLVYQADKTLPDDMAVKAGSSHLKTWTVYNRGSKSPKGLFLMRVDDGPIKSARKTALPDIRPGTTGDISVKITVPNRKGTHTATFKLVNREGTQVSSKKGALYVRVSVD